MAIKTNSHTTDQQQTSSNMTTNVARNETEFIPLPLWIESIANAETTTRNVAIFQIKNVKKEVIVFYHNNKMTTKDLKLKSVTVKSLQECKVVL